MEVDDAVAGGAYQQLVSCKEVYAEDRVGDSGEKKRKLKLVETKL